MKTYAQDPIDYIRDFRFAIYQQNSGSSKGPTRKEQDLIIRLTDVTGSGTADVVIPHANYSVVKHVAAWLEKQAFYVFPLAEVITGETHTWINLQVAGTDIQFGSVKAQLEALLGHFAPVTQRIADGCVKIIPPRAEREAMSQPGYGQPGMLGRQDNRTPQNWGRGGNGGSGNNNNW